MKKMIVVILVLGFTTMALAQRDAQLGLHDVLLNSVQQGCQSCHIPHTSTETEYIWKYAASTTATTPGDPWSTEPTAAFHTLACLSCHDGGQTGISISNSMQVAMDASGLRNDHPVHTLVGTHVKSPALNGMRFYGAGATQDLKYIECGSCHDPHKGQTGNFKFLRSSSSAPVNYTLQDAKLMFCRNCHSK